MTGRATQVRRATGTARTALGIPVVPARNRQAAAGPALSAATRIGRLGQSAARPAAEPMPRGQEATGPTRLASSRWPAEPAGTRPAPSPAVQVGVALIGRARAEQRRGQRSAAAPSSTVRTTAVRPRPAGRTGADPAGVASSRGVRRAAPRLAAVQVGVVLASGRASRRVVRLSRPCRRRLTYGYSIHRCVLS